MSSEPTPNNPYLSFLPDMGAPIEIRAGAVAPTDPEAEAIKAAQNLQTPTWIKDEISFGAPPSATEQPVYAPQAATAPPQPVYAQPAPAVLPTFSAPTMSTGDAGIYAGAPKASAYVPPPTPGRTPGSVVMPGKPLQHPVLTALLRDFGIVTRKSHEVKVGKFVFTIRPVNAEILSYAVSVASKMAQTNDEYQTRLRMVIGVLSISGIDGLPLHEIFGVDLTNIRESITDPFFPPFTVAVKTSVPLLRFMFEDLGLTPISVVSGAYETHYNDDTEDEEVTEAPKATAPTDTRVRFKCSIEGCGHVEDVVPVILDAAKGAIQARYCPVHGQPLTPIAYTRDLANIPLA